MATKTLILIHCNGVGTEYALWNPESNTFVKAGNGEIVDAINYKTAAKFGYAHPAALEEAQAWLKMFDYPRKDGKKRVEYKIT